MAATIRSTMAALIVMAAHSGAMAAPTTYGDYYEDKVAKSCSSSYSCRLDFTRLPNKFLTITRFACYIETGTPLRIVALGRTNVAGGLTSASIPIPFTANYTGNGTYYYSINQEIDYKSPKQFYILASIETSSVGNKYVTCTISGRLTNS